MTYLENLTVITDTDIDIISGEIERLAGEGNVHATNGTYNQHETIVVPTVLGGFSFAIDQGSTDNDLLLIAVNSDKSMQTILSKKGSNDTIIPQLERALNVGKPLAEIFPQRQVVLVYYDTETPLELYKTLEAQLGKKRLSSLFKFGYGLSADAPKIEGATCFSKVYGFPLPKDGDKPLCYDITIAEDQSDIVLVHDLTKEQTADGVPYMTKANKIGFPLPESLASHQAVTSTPEVPPFKPDTHKPR